MSELQTNIEPLLYRHGVQLAVAGHFHNVQRQSAVYRNEVIQRATVIINGDGQEVAVHINATATVYMVIGTAGE